MKKQKNRPIIMIGTIIMRKAHYLRTYRKRLDGQYQVEVTSNLRDAHEFDSPEEARQICGKIFNPYEREYVVEETLVDWAKEKAIARFGEFK